MMNKRFCLLPFLLIITLTSFCQIEKPGTPRSFQLGLSVPAEKRVSISQPDLSLLKEEDLKDAYLEKPYRVGVQLPLQLSMENVGYSFSTVDGGGLWLLRLQCAEAVAIGIDFSRFYLPKGSALYLYRPDRSGLIGAFTSDNNTSSGIFATRPILGDEIILEYYQPSSVVEVPHLDISGINYIYRGWDVGIRDGSLNFGGSGACEVNIHCSEGDNWQPQAKGVVRILARVKNQSFWCTGSLLNNTNYDFSPLVLTANHCSENAGLTSTPADVEKWIFYFNYEGASCPDPASEPAIQSMVGAQKLASSENPSNIGSDFYLVRLNQSIPGSYNAFYNGWSRSLAISSSGTCIHHPQGDIKKISTYTKPLTSGTWQTTPNTHWIVSWSETSNGFGVTEAGSSGSPLFNSDGLIIGTLTGGESGCTNTSGTDYYGKVAFSWLSNGSIDSMQLSPWLDPGSTNDLMIQGTYNDKQVTADFTSDTTVIRIGNSLNFYDRSFGNPTSWSWEFEGGDPSVSNEQNPVNIKYNAFGKFSVKLTAVNANSSDTLVRENYVDVRSMLFPNPTKGTIYLLTDLKNSGQMEVEIFGLDGRLLQKQEVQYVGSSVSLDLPDHGDLFLVRIIQEGNVQVEKVVVIKN